jgi:hypothetical protein
VLPQDLDQTAGSLPTGVGYREAGLRLQLVNLALEFLIGKVGAVDADGGNLRGPLEPRQLFVHPDEFPNRNDGSIPYLGSFQPKTVTED